MADKVKDDSSDTETAEKSPLTLDKLPVDVLGEVTGWLSLADCLTLRKVSRDLRSFVDSTAAHCENLTFIFRESSVTMKLDDLEITNENMEDGSCKIISNRKDTQRTKAHRDDRNFTQVMFADATTFLRNPKLEIGQIEFEFQGLVTQFELTPKLMQFLKSLNLRLNVRSIRSKDLKLLHSIQEYLNPEKLEEILYDANHYDHRFIEIAETNLEILKNPKLKLNGIIFLSYSDETAVKFSKTLKSINSQLRIQSLIVEDIRWIPTMLQSMNPEKVEEMIINGFFGLTVRQFDEIARMQRWKTKTRFLCNIPEGIGLEQLMDFKQLRCCGIEFTEENLIIIRDILLKSPHFDSFALICYPTGNEHFEDELNERIDRIMIQDPAYDALTRRFSIPDSLDYFQLELEENYYLTLIIRRISVK